MNNDFKIVSNIFCIVFLDDEEFNVYYWLWKFRKVFVKKVKNISGDVLFLR